MSLSPTDLSSIVQALQPEFKRTQEEIKAALQPEFDKISGEFDKVRSESKSEFDKVRSESKSEFDKVRSEAKQNFSILNKKIESLRRSNRKDHNLIIKTFDERDIKLKNRVTELENKQTYPPFKNL